MANKNNEYPKLFKGNGLERIFKNKEEEDSYKELSVEKELSIK